MKKIITKTVEGYDIITGVQNAAIDPVESQRAVAEAVSKTDEFKFYGESVKAAAAIYKQITAAKVRALRANSTPKYGTLFDDWRRAQDVAKVALDALHKVAAPIIESTQIPCGLRDGEHLVDDDEGADVAKKLDSLQDFQALTTDREIIPDHRGVKCWVQHGERWKSDTITRIGMEIPANVIVDHELSQDQIAEIRAQETRDNIAAMSADDRRAELDLVVSGLRSRAAVMKAELDIDEDPSALQKAQQWLIEEKQRAKDLYR